MMLSRLVEDTRTKLYLIYSMWDGYLQPDHADRDLLRYIGSRKIVHLHTSGHAYVETIAKLIETPSTRTVGCFQDG